MTIKIPKTHFLGINLARTDGDDIPLGFLTPGGTDAAATKRKSTVRQWVNCDFDLYSQVWAENYDQFEKDHPTANIVHDTSDDPKFTGTPHRRYSWKKVEGKDYKFNENMLNDPQLGFHITKSISRSGGWSGNNKLIRIFDPRGFELEISVDNLVKLMSMTTFIDGECQTECVWGRDGSRNVLLPVNSQLYTDAVANTTYSDNKGIKLKDVKFGDNVTLKSNEYNEGLVGVYLGLWRLYTVNDPTCNTYQSHPSLNNNIITVSKRYIIKVDTKDGCKYHGVPSATVLTINQSVNSPVTRDFEIDASDYIDESINGIGTPLAVLLANVKPEDVSSSITFKKFEMNISTETVHKYERTLRLWADIPGNMWMYNTPINYDNSLVVSQSFKKYSTYIDKTHNVWKYTHKKSDHSMWNYTTSPQDYLKQAEYDWYQLQCNINGKTFTLIP